MRHLMADTTMNVELVSSGSASGTSASDEVGLHQHIQSGYNEDIASVVNNGCSIKNNEVKTLHCLSSSSFNKYEEPEACRSSSRAKIFHTTLTSSTNTELTEECYSFTPSKASILDRELIEQDILSEAFNTIKTSETGNNNDKEHNICVIPTSLCLNSSQIAKINKHSNTCDILADLDSTIVILNESDMERNTLIPISPISSNIKLTETDKIERECYKISSLPVTLIDNAAELSIITDKPSSSSDYLSATYVVSPDTVVSSGFSQFNVEEILTKMDNIDSGLETAGMLESLNSHKDITLTEVSLTESTEASFCANTCDTTFCGEQNDIEAMHNLTCTENLPSFGNSCSTPYKSFPSLPNFTMYDMEQSNEFYSAISGICDPSVDKYSSCFCDIPSDSPLITEKSDNISTVQVAYKPEPEVVQEKPRTSSKWIVDMSSTTKSDISKSSVNVCSDPRDKTVGVLKSACKSMSSAESYKTRSSVDSHSTEKSNHNFFIDLSTLAVEPSDHNEIAQDSAVKKNMFSIFIEFDDDKSTTTKEMPAKLSSCLNSKKSIRTGSSSCSKSPKTPNTSIITCTSSDTGTLFFEKLESLCDDPNLSIPEIVRTPLNVDRHAESNLMITVLKEEPASVKSSDLFVKLSDLDKPAPKVEKAQTVGIKSNNHERMSRSIPDNDWRESNPRINLRFSEMISSLHSENVLSLHRLFPHLKGDFTRSMPGGVRCQTSDESELSSVQASFSRLLVETCTSEEIEQISSFINNCQSSFGQDLLRMFLEEIGPDVTIEVSGRRVKAHKCILASRCQYFARLLSGGWVESTGNVISLPTFSFNVVHFALCHIYTGISVIPDSIRISELGALADMLCLEGLKESMSVILKSKYCHNFHKPCTLCIAGVLYCFPKASIYGLDDLCRKCVRWITKHFDEVWPTKAFATLPQELIEKCYQEHIVNLSVENVVETVYGCGRIVALMSKTRWAVVVARICVALVQDSKKFIALHLYAVFRAMVDKPVASELAMQALNDCMSSAILITTMDECCRAYEFLWVYLKGIQSRSVPDMTSMSLLAANAPAWQLLCETTLVNNAFDVSHAHEFKELPQELRDRLCDRGCIDITKQSCSRALNWPACDSTSSPVTNSEKAIIVQLNKREALNTVRHLSVRTTKAHDQRAKYNSTKMRQPHKTKFRYAKPRGKEEKNSQPKMVLSTESSLENSAPSTSSLPMPATRSSKTATARSQTSLRAPLQMPASRNAKTVTARSIASTPGAGKSTVGTSTAVRSSASSSTAGLTPTATSSVGRYTAGRFTARQSIGRTSSVCKPAYGSSPAGLSTAGASTLCPSSARTSTVGPSTAGSFTPKPYVPCVSLDHDKYPLGGKYATYTKAKHKTEECVQSSTVQHCAKILSNTITKKTVKLSKIPVLANRIRVRQPTEDRLDEPSTPRSTASAEYPVLKRSDTFLKDEPTFGDKTAYLDEN